MSVRQMLVSVLQEKIQSESEVILLDVRELNEYEFAHIEGSLHIPLAYVPDKINEINKDVDCVVICHHGMRSQQVANFLVQSGFSRIYNLSGGIDAWSVECDDTVLRY